MCFNLGWCNRCKWSADSSQGLLFVSYQKTHLNILDVIKGSFTLNHPIELEEDMNGKFLFSVYYSQFYPQIAYS